MARGGLLSGAGVLGGNKGKVKISSPEKAPPKRCPLGKGSEVALARLPPLHCGIAAAQSTFLYRSDDVICPPLFPPIRPISDRVNEPDGPKVMHFTISSHLTDCWLLKRTAHKLCTYNWINGFVISDIHTPGNVWSRPLYSAVSYDAFPAPDNINGWKSLAVASPRHRIYKMKLLSKTGMKIFEIVYDIPPGLKCYFMYIFFSNLVAYPTAILHSFKLSVKSFPH